MRSLAVVLTTGLSACAGTPASRSLQLRAYLGAADDGGWAFAEVNEFPGRPTSGRVHVVGGDGKLRRTSDIPAPALVEATSRAAAAGERPERTAEASLATLRPEGFVADLAAGLPVAVGGPRLRLAVPVPVEVSLRREDDELRLVVRLADGDEELVAYRLPVAGVAWVGEVRLLPGLRRMLVLTGSASSSRSALYRLEGLGEVDLSGAQAALLDSRAVRSIQAGELKSATADLEQAVALAPDDATSHYNLACAYALADRLDEAILALGRAVDLDPDRLKPLALSDPDLAALHTRVEFRLMVEPRLPGAGP